MSLIGLLLCLAFALTGCAPSSATAIGIADAQRAEAQICNRAWTREWNSVSAELLGPDSVSVDLAGCTAECPKDGGLAQCIMTAADCQSLRPVAQANVPCSDAADDLAKGLAADSAQVEAEQQVCFENAAKFDDECAAAVSHVNQLQAANLDTDDAGAAPITPLVTGADAVPAPSGPNLFDQQQQQAQQMQQEQMQQQSQLLQERNMLEQLHNQENYERWQREQGLSTCSVLGC